jgi:hypothetical protein
MHDHYDPRARFWLVLSLCALLVFGALQAARAQSPDDTQGASRIAPDVQSPARPAGAHG